MRKWILPASLLLMLAGCVAAPVTAMSRPSGILQPAAARALLRSLRPRENGGSYCEWYCYIAYGSDRAETIHSVAFTRDAIRINNHVIPLSGMDQIGWALRNPLAGSPHAWIRLTSDWQLVVAPPGDNAARGRQVADALLTLRDAATPGALARADAAFADVVARYRQAEPKPEPDEDMRRAEVQAEGAVREKNFYDADTLYDTALAAAPWWPQGHFNRALILESEEDYAGAVTEMQCYLALVPFASNARAAQDKIYQWQAHLHAENSR